jgi:hypothetical protein
VTARSSGGGDASPAPKSDRLLGYDLATGRGPAGEFVVTETRGDGTPLPVRERYGFVWTTLGTPTRDVVDIPEADEPDRRLVLCGSVAVRASGLRIVENFLDMAHFPFVHTDILGAEPHTEVMHYTTEIRRDVDEVWATNCQFFQPKAAMSAKEGIMTQYMYRVATPFVTLLYKTCPNFANRWDVICLFAGGPSAAMLDACRMAVAASRMLEDGVDPAIPGERRGRKDSRIDFRVALHLATAGGADVLDLPVGRLSPGCHFDALLIDPEAPGGTIRRWDTLDTDEELIEKIVFTASRPNIAKVWVDGRQQA